MLAGLPARSAYSMPSPRRPVSLANLKHQFSQSSDDIMSTSISDYKYNQVLSPTSTLSSGYESGGCMESKIDDLLYSSTQSLPLQQPADSTDDCEYFELESDQYICLGSNYSSNKPAPAPTNDKLQKVRESMIQIIEDLQSLGYETNLDDLSKAVKSTVRNTNKKCSRSSAKHSYKRSSSLDHMDMNNNSNTDSLYMKSPVDHLLTEINHQQNQSAKEKLYDSLISNLALECDSGSSQSYEEEPIYEEIYDDSDFDFVSHSDTYRKSSCPPALPPRVSHSLDISSQRAKRESNRRTSSPCLTEVQKVAWKSGSCRKSSSWHSVHV